jgi:hypothetical protein
MSMRWLVPLKKRSVQRSEEALWEGLRELAIAAGDVSLYCDRVEHAESSESELIEAAGERLCKVAVRLADALRLDLGSLYGRRLAAIELRNPVREVAEYDGGRAAAAARSWRELQNVQRCHDRAYHLDVVELGKGGEARHCALHVGKLAGWYARALDSEEALREVRDQRLADTLIFGLKLCNLSGVRLEEAPLPRFDEADDTPAPIRLTRSSGL